jgi:uncharacterized protein YndB with AHSA1/START domain
MTALQSARSVADVSEGTVVAVVEVAVPADRVFRALTDPQEMVQWWGSPELYRVTEWKADLRVGGRWQSTGRGADGRAFTVSGEFLEIDPPRRLVHTWQPDWEQGGPPTTVHYQLDPIAAGTRVTVRHTGFGDRSASCLDHGRGWERVLGWLADHLCPRVERRYFLCRLLGPRPTFPQDITPEEADLMKRHGVYWRELLGRGQAVVFGPVADPKGVWGLAVAAAASEEELAKLLAADPTIASGRGFRFESLPMLGAVHG